MKTKITKKSVAFLLNGYRKTVAAYVRSKELPKYIANEMDKQLAEAIAEVDAGNYEAANTSIHVYVELYKRYAAGNYSVNIPRTNKYYHEELNPNQACGFLINLGLKIIEPDYTIRLLDCMRKFEVIKSTASSRAV